MNREQSLGIRITDMIDAGEPPETLDDNALMDFYEARDGFTLLQQLEEVHVPIGFSRRLKSRVRRRSGGRLFNPVHQPFGPRISVESFVILAIAVMAACWLMMTDGRSPNPPVLFLDAPSSVKMVE